jgi:hypothetical protein
VAKAFFVTQRLSYTRSETPSRKRPAATRISGTACTVCNARTFLPQRFVSGENKGSKIQLPKLKVASSSLVARSKFPLQIAKSDRLTKKVRAVRGLSPPPILLSSQSQLQNGATDRP